VYFAGCHAGDGSHDEWRSCSGEQYGVSGRGRVGQLQGQLLPRAFPHLLQTVPPEHRRPDCSHLHHQTCVWVWSLFVIGRGRIVVLSSENIAYVGPLCIVHNWPEVCFFFFFFFNSYIEWIILIWHLETSMIF